MKKFLVFLLFVVFLSPLKDFSSSFVPYEKLPIPLNLDSIEFPYPDNVKKLGIEGKVYLRLHIDTLGNVIDVVLMIHSLHPELDISAVKVARQLKFTHAEQGGKKFAIWYVFPVTYKLEESVSSKDTLTYFDILNNNGKVSDTLNLPDKFTLNFLNLTREKSIDIDTTVFIPEEVVYPKITNPEDFITSKTIGIPVRQDGCLIYVEILLDEKGVPLKYTIKNPATKELDSLALETVKSLKFTPAKYLDKPIPSRFLIRLIFKNIHLRPQKVKRGKGLLLNAYG